MRANNVRTIPHIHTRLTQNHSHILFHAICMNILAVSACTDSNASTLLTEHATSVADPGCLYRIPDPDLYPSLIPDLGSRIKKQQQKRGVKKFVVVPFFCSHKFHIIENYFIFEMLKKIILANFQRIIELFSQKIVRKLSKIWVWDLGSEIQDPAVKAQDPGSGSATLHASILQPYTHMQIHIYPTVELQNK